MKGVNKHKTRRDQDAKMAQVFLEHALELIGGTLLFITLWIQFARTGIKVPWFRRPKNRPAVYLFQSVRDPSCIKVGYTSRKVETRMSEIAQKRGPVRLLFSLRMPHAYVAEQVAHKMLMRSRGVRSLGGEWYVADPARVRERVVSAAHRTRRQAQRRFAWPKGAEIFIWKDII